MKKISFLLIFAVALLTAGIYTSCTKDNSSGSEPRIKYVRITDPASSDSLLVGAYQSNLIAIVGENLQDAIEIWFNDQKATLTPTYITSTSILVSVPSKIPIEITNTLKIVFASGKTLLHNFKVEISEPLVSSMNCEYVLAGNTATIRGDYFYQPITVTFTGGATGEVVSVEDKILQVTVPDGAQPGPITVKTNFGETKSDFWFRDNRNIFISSDPWSGWWGESYVVKDPGNSDPPAINGNYIRVNKSIGSWNWMEVAGGPPSAMGDISKNIPDEAILKPADYNLKFEVNTLKPYNNNMIKINAGLSSDFNNNQYLWAPPYDTKGEWQTVVIPFEEIANSYGSALSVSGSGYYSRILFHGGGDLDCDMCFDNFRIVPKVLKK
ncbi:MAG: glycan-binding surface protein [Agriterribacter sp.]